MSPLSYTPTDEEKTQIACCRNVWVRMISLRKAGNRNDPHKHDYDHITLLAKGSVRATVDGRESVFHAPQLILTEARKLHFFEALEDDTLLCCIHAVRDKDTGDIIEPDMVVGHALTELVSTVQYAPFARPRNFEYPDEDQ